MSPDSQREADISAALPALSYLSGFATEQASEALPGALPQGQNSPQQAPYGLYAEQLSGTPFTAARADNRRSWLYRIRPSATHGAFRRIDSRKLASAPFADAAPSPNRLRWDPLALPDGPVDFLGGLATMAACGAAAERTGVAIHIYRATAGMGRRIFYDADGELLIVPEQGRLLLQTEFGALAVAPGEIALVPRGVKFRVELPDGRARGYVCENYGALFRLPELGPIGANGLANSRDFLTPRAAFEDSEEVFELIVKFAGGLWATILDHSPLDVVAWHGNYAPCKYDLARFNAVNSVSFDHPDPSIFTVLTAPSETPGAANCDFVIFPPRWAVAEHTFRPPFFHRNTMNEFMGLVRGAYEAKASGFLPGGASLHNCMSAHGPDAATFAAAAAAELSPVRLPDALAFMFETRLVLCPSQFALTSPALQADYDSCWQGLARQFAG